MCKILLSAPTIVHYHIYILPTLILLLNDLQILVESFILLITEFSKVFLQCWQDDYAKNTTKYFVALQ